MSCNEGDVITDWKRLWQLVSGILHETPENTVYDELFNVSKQLQDGLLQFRPPTATDTTLESLLKGKKQEKLLSFTQNLQILLDLNSVQCWEIMCYYLTNEYRGTASSLTAFISTEVNMVKLLDDIWGYYSLERMIVLKIVRNLLIFSTVPNHPYHREYKKIMDKITLSKLRDSYVEQLEHLINENPPSKLSAGNFFNYQAKLVSWSERNAREINEVVHILLLIFDAMPADAVFVKRLFACFKRHSFGKSQRLLTETNIFHVELITRLSYSECILLLKCIAFPNAGNDVDTVKDVIDSLEREIMQMCHNPEDGPVLLAWMLLNMRYIDIDADEDNLNKYLQFGKRAVSLNCFKFLTDLISSPMFKDDSLIARIARKTIYDLLSLMCDLFDGDGSCARHPYIYELLCELLSWPTLAKDFCSKEDEGGVRSLYNTQVEIFPMDFVHFSMLAVALTKGGMGDYVKSQLESIPILTDVYDESKYSLRAVDKNEYILNNDYVPFRGIDFVVPSDTSAVVMERNGHYCVHFRCTTNYFHVLHNEINCLLAEAVQLHSDFSNSGRLKRVNSGLLYLELALQRIKTISLMPVEMVYPTEMCIDLLNNFKKVHLPPVDLMANCINVCTALLPLAESEVITRILNLKILPLVINETLADPKKYALGMGFDSSLVGNYLIDVEKKMERYDLLLAYIAFLRTYTKMAKSNLLQVEIPGAIFLLSDVFSHLHAWRFQLYEQKNRIYAEIMGFICDILDTVILVTDRNEETSKNKCLLRDICVYSLLNMENGVILLRFISVGNAYLQHTMEMESNWMQAQTSGLKLLVRLSMRILMQLLRLKTTVYDSSELSPLESLIYTQPKQRDTLRIIPVVTSYMSNIFDRWLPILSCRLLKRIALEFNMSLLACLDMEPDQIRLTFLQKLPDELESDSLKVAILELVEACIEKQPGVTEAFFKVHFPNEKRTFAKKKDAQIADSVVIFLEDYLEAVQKDPNTVQNALPMRIMNIFHSLWKNNMQMLVQELIAKENFWQQLCCPLFSELRPNVRVYTQILNIMSIEIFSAPSKTVDAKLKAEMMRFFQMPHFANWLQYALDLPKIPAVMPTAHEMVANDSPDWLCRLQTFKDFLLILLRRQPVYMEIPSEQMKLLAERCLDVLVDRTSFIVDLRPFIILAEIYLLALLSFKHSYTTSEGEDRAMLEQVIQFLSGVASCYDDMHVRAREACLAIAIKCSHLLAEELLKDATVALSFLHSTVSIICSELQCLENCIRCEMVSKRTMQNSSTSLVLSLNLLKAISIIFHSDNMGNWVLPFIANKVFQRLLSCTASIMQMHTKQNLAIELLDVLIIFAKGNCSAEFIYCDVGDYLWLKLLPPKELLQTSFNMVKPTDDTWTVQKWWPIYARGIELVLILLRRHRHNFLRDVLQFVGIHEEYLMDSLLLGKQSLEPRAMQLIKCAAMLICDLVEYEKQWRLEHSKSLFNLMYCVKQLLGYAIAMFHQPKNLRWLVTGRRPVHHDDNGSEEGHVPEMIVAFNDLTEIIVLCVTALQRFSPSILDLLCESEFEVYKWEPILEIHFGAPKLDEGVATLTLGTVLSVVDVYVKALNLQNYTFHELPLNVVPTLDGIDKDACSYNSNISLLSLPSQRALSSSVSSAMCPSTEVLSNLNCELCLMALEHILLLAASQSMLALRNRQLQQREKQLIRREISTELSTFHEFMRKKIVIEFREHREIWHRRKHGQVLMQHLDVDEGLDASRASTSASGSGSANTSASASASSSTAASKSPSSTTDAAAPRRSSDVRNSMRVNVVRRLHLQQQQQLSRTPATDDTFEMTQDFSPIGGHQQSRDPLKVGACASTPILIRSPIHLTAENVAREDLNECVSYATDDAGPDDESIQFFPPDEPKYSPLSYVQLVEEDYLHFISNLFSVICQSN